MEQKVQKIDIESIMEVVRNLNPCVEFREIGDSFKAEYKNWMQKCINLQHKYESMAQWTKTSSEISVQFGEELVKIQIDNKQNIDALLQLATLEIHKNIENVKGSTDK